MLAGAVEKSNSVAIAMLGISQTRTNCYTAPVLAQLPIFTLITWGLATLLTLILLGRIVVIKLYSFYPVFTAYLACNLLQSAVGVYLYQWYGFWSKLAFWFGWTTQAAIVVVRALAAAEVCHQVLGKFKGVWAMSSRLMVMCGILVLGCALYFGQDGYQFVVTKLEIGLESFIATCVVGLFCFARYYDVQVSRPVGLLGLGLGLNSCLKILNDVVFQRFVKAYLSKWNYVSSSAFIAVLGIWIWGLWEQVAVPVSEPELSTATAYQTLMPQVNRRLLELNEQLGKLWSKEQRKP